MESDQNNPSKLGIWWKDLREFLCALWPHTAAKITGGTLAALITIAVAFGIRIPRWVIWALIAFAFFASAFVAYRRQRRVIEISKINFLWPMVFLSFSIFYLTVWYIGLPQKSKGVLETEMVDKNLYKLYEVNPTNHVIIFFIEIYNPGRPTIVRNWYLTVSGAGNGQMTNVFSGFCQRNLADLVQQNNTTNFSFVNNYIFDKTRRTPIPTGGMETGFIEFTVLGPKEKWLEDSKTVYEVSFADVYGNSYTDRFNWPAPLPESP